MKEPGLKEVYIDYSSKIGMRDQMAITQFSRCEQDGGLVAYFFGDTTVVVREWIDTDGAVHLHPIRGDQVA